MKRIFLLLLSLSLFSCNDGDIIVTTFNFDNAPLKTCGGAGNYVFYKENPNVFESISLKLTTTDSIYQTEGEKSYDLGVNSFVNYRSYDGPLGNDYFCNNIPPTSPKVLSEYVATSGTVKIIVKFKYDEGGKEANSVFSEVNLGARQTISKDVQVVLKNIVLISGEDQIIQETLNMGTIENVEVMETVP